MTATLGPPVVELHGLSTRIGERYVHRDLELRVERGQIVGLVGGSGSGKTTLLRQILGLIRPTAGAVRIFGQDLGAAGRLEQAALLRRVGMLFQGGALFSALPVFDNIASPLKLARAAHIDERVRELASKLHIEMFLDRLPAALSGGQQQRVALARALAKNAPLMLFDEPLVNLDYKLREELRDELTQLFAVGNSTVVYATTEPSEALLLGGHTAVLDRGELLQYGPTAEVFHRPASIRVARAFSDPPINLLQAERSTSGLCLCDGTALVLELPRHAPKALVLGIRGSALRERARSGDLELAGKVDLAEISGSQTFVYVQTALGELVAQLTGVHELELATPIKLYLDPSQVYVFDAAGPLLTAPQRHSEAS